MGGGAYSNSNIKNGMNGYNGGGGQSSGFGKYDNNTFDNGFSGSKESTNYTNSNYRKPFNPNNM